MWRRSKRDSDDLSFWWNSRAKEAFKFVPPLQVKKWLTDKVKDWDGKAYWIGDQDRGLEIE